MLPSLSALTPARLSALSVLVFGGPCTLGRLADVEDVAGPTMTRIVDGLCREGLAQRAQHPHSGRVSDLIDRLRSAGCVYAEEEAALITARFCTDLDREAAIDKRCAGTPLELVLGEATFAGVRVGVRPGVFLPRRRAEALVDLSDRLGREREGHREKAADRRPITALDLGCGTGAIAAALRTRHPTWSVHASDVDPVAVSCAQSNADRFGFAVHRSDWLDDLPRHLLGEFDLITAHLPYVPTADLALLPRDYRAVEPVGAVDGGVDGLDPWRSVAGAVGRWLDPEGRVLTQVTAHQEQGAIAIAVRSGLQPEVVRYVDSVVIVARWAGTR